MPIKNTITETVNQNRSVLMRDFCMDILLPVGIVLTLVAAVMLAIVLGVNYLTFPGDKATIEQLRADAARLDGQSTDVTGLVTRTNCKIRRWQRYNNMGWCGWTIPNGWDRIETIQVPTR